MVQFHIQDLSFAYPEQHRLALDGVTLDVERGSYVCLCGQSGCGKTTLLRHLKTVLTPHGDVSGSVVFEGCPLADVPLSDQARFIGFVMQDPDAQVVTGKVWHELAFGLGSLGQDQSAMRVRVAEMASYFGIQHWLHKEVAELSGGQKQLLNLASVMAMQPSVLILDEPTSQLDPIAAVDFLNTVRKINRELGTTVIITEHRLEEVFAFADEVVVMEAGRIFCHGSPRRVAEMLYRQDSSMIYALPAPMRIFYGVQAAGKDEDGISDIDPASMSDMSDGPCRTPLTVREGRQWLLEYVETHDLPVRALPEEGSAVWKDAEAAVQVKDVWFRYEREAPDVLRGVSFKAPRGAFCALLGGNGTGKSTFLKVLCGICKPYRGGVRILERKLAGWKHGSLFQGTIAMLPQDPQNLFVKKTVLSDLEEMVIGSKGTEGKDAQRNEEARFRVQERVQDIAHACGIEGVLKRHPFDLSGGELQRAALAKVLLTKPKVLLLDEPTKGMDALSKRGLAEMLRGFIQEGMTIIMVSHDVEFCARYADVVSLLFDGSVATTNVPRSFFSMNSFYTTAANRMSRHVFANAVTDEDVMELCLA